MHRQEKDHRDLVLYRMISDSSLCGLRRPAANDSVPSQSHTVVDLHPGRRNRQTKQLKDVYTQFQNKCRTWYIEDVSYINMQKQNNNRLHNIPNDNALDDFLHAFGRSKWRLKRAATHECWAVESCKFALGLELVGLRLLGCIANLSLGSCHSTHANLSLSLLVFVILYCASFNRWFHRSCHAQSPPALERGWEIIFRWELTWRNHETQWGVHCHVRFPKGHGDTM